MRRSNDQPSRSLAKMPCGSHAWIFLSGIVFPVLGLLCAAGCNKPPAPAPAAPKPPAQQKADAEPAEDEEELAIRPLVEPPDEDPLSPQTLQAVRELIDLDAELTRDDDGHIVTLTLAEGTAGSALEHAGRLGTLRRLIANECEITEAHLAELKSLGSLRELELAAAQLGNAVDTLARLPNLERLVLAGSDLTNERLQPLEQLAKLTQLDVSWTKVGDDGLTHLADLASLKQLDLSYTEVSDEQLEQLAKLPELETLILDGTDVTPDGVKRLREQRPELRVLGVR